MKNEVHIGALIRKQLKEDGRAASWLAKKINCERTNIYKILNKPSIDTSVLQKIGSALDTNFFSFLCDCQKTDIIQDKTDDCIQNDNIL